MKHTPFSQVDGISSMGSGPHRAAPASSRPRPHSIWDDLPLQIVPSEDPRSFADIGLPPALVTALSRAGIARPFPIQAATIPDILSGRDLLGRAATGAGKTLAFGLPLIVRPQGATSTPRRPIRSKS